MSLHPNYIHRPTATFFISVFQQHQVTCINHKDYSCVDLCINPLKPKLLCIIFKHSVRTAKKTQLFTITKINWLTLIKEIIAVYSENHTKHINTKRSF
jgi:hypothetical protein